MFLDDVTFKTVVDSSPLVSIDLLIKNGQGQFLLGQRTNKPAQGDWFVPGGRIRKNESLAAAFARLSKEELGLELALADAVLQGPYDHYCKIAVCMPIPRPILFSVPLQHALGAAISRFGFVLPEPLLSTSWCWRRLLPSITFFTVVRQ